MRSTAEYSGVRVTSGTNKKRRIGKVLRAVFYADDYRLAGFIVKRPDFLFMFKRSDRFLAWDRLELTDQGIVASQEKDSWDKQAIERLRLDWDRAMLLQGMPVVDYYSQKIGAVDDVWFDPKTGQSIDLMVSTGIGSKALIGQIRIPVTSIKGYEDTNIVLLKNALVPQHEGGLATIAGKQAAIVGNTLKNTSEAAQGQVGVLAEKAGQSGERLGYQTGKAISNAKQKLTRNKQEAQAGIDSLAHSGGKALGRQVKRTKGMFQSFKDEYKKASKG
ncbi:MAG: PRC-barrel domain-containing protein [Coriobacteriia bacterium]|nr:PRC-barrel domain-containing protein [Coriobacteriia bacterium]